MKKLNLLFLIVLTCLIFGMSGCAGKMPIGLNDGGTESTLEERINNNEQSISDEDDFDDAVSDEDMTIEDYKMVYEDYDEFSDGLCAVMQNRLWGYIDESSKLVINCEYIERGAFVDGICPVKKDDYWGVIDKFNNVIVDFQYNDVSVDYQYNYYDNASIGNATLGYSWDYLYGMDCKFRFGFLGVCVGTPPNTAWGVIDTSGEYLIPLNKEYTRAYFIEPFICMREICGNKLSANLPGPSTLYNKDGTVFRNRTMIVDIYENGNILVCDNIGGYDYNYDSNSVMLKDTEGWNDYSYKIINMDGETVKNITEDAFKATRMDESKDYNTSSGNDGGKLGKPYCGWRYYRYLQYDKNTNDYINYVNYVSTDNGRFLLEDWGDARSASGSMSGRDLDFKDNYVAVYNFIDITNNNTRFYKSDGSLVKQLEGSYEYWNGFAINEDTVNRELIDLTSDVQYRFWKFDLYYAVDNPITKKVAIVKDEDGIFYGLFIDKSLAYDTSYNSVTYDLETQSFLLEKGNTKTRIYIDENCKVSEEPVE